MHVDTEFKQTLDYLFSRLPFFTRDGKKAIKYSLDTIRTFSNRLGNPHQKYKTIHIAGTNGKGSVSHSLAAVLQVHGYKTGLYTSPHLSDFRERMKVNGCMAEKEFIVNFVAQHKQLIEETEPSFFEITQAMAFEWFSLQKTDIAVIETGMGGRFDSTNIITPLLSVITNISLDHQDMLGDTPEKIAGEKAGIIKPHTPVLTGRYQPGIHFVFEQKAKENQSKLYNANDFDTDTTIDFQLKGICQKENLKTILAALKILEKDYGFEFNSEKTAYALSNVKQLTGLRGRWDTLKQASPKIMADTAHNEDGLQQVFQQLMAEQYENLHIVTGMMSDKNREKLWQYFPKNVTYYFCKPAIPRGLDAEILKKEATEAGLNGTAFASCEEALRNALKNAGKNDLVFLGGSTFVVAELIDSPLLKQAE